jgi:nucleolar GTP-binding protein
MSFQNIKSVQDAESYLDAAIKKAVRKVSELRKKASKDKLKKAKYLESTKMQIMKDILISDMQEILKDFPYAHDLPVFYRELTDAVIGIDRLKRSLSVVRLIKNKINEFFKLYNRRLTKSSSVEQIMKCKKEFYGRASSLFKRSKKAFAFLENARKIFRRFPVIKTKLKTIAIAGFPNVGKSTLMGKLSPSKPEVAAYSFTTKGIMIGYTPDNIQLLDTPGTLNRVDKMNMIEKQAWLALNLLAEKIIYIFDLTEPFPLKDQEELYKRLKQLGKPIIVYLSKTDILDKEKVSSFKRRYKEALTDTGELKKQM